MFGNDNYEATFGNLLEQVITSCPELADPMIDKVLEYIKTFHNNDNEIFEVNNDDVKKKVDKLVFQYIRKHFDILTLRKR